MYTAKNLIAGISMANTNTPYQELEPDLILNAIDSVGYSCSGSLSALNSYENRVYQVGIENSAPLIAKFYRPNRWTNAAILEEHAFAAELLSHEIPVVAPLMNSANQTLHEYQNFRFGLFPRKGGRALELDSLEQLEWMGRFIGRLHAVGASKSFQQRMQINIESYGYVPYKVLLKYNFIPIEMEKNYRALVETILKTIDEIFQQVGSVEYIRLHGDCHAGNVLWNDYGPQIVDLDDCLTGPAIQDIWMLLSGDNEHDVDIQLNYILRGYEMFYHFNHREIQLIEPLRTLRMIHYTAWLAKRWEDPAFPLNFPWFDTPKYWQEHLLDLEKQLSRLDKIKMT